MDKIHSIALTRSRRKQHEDLSTNAEVKQLQELAGQLNILVHAILPAAPLLASKCLQNVCRLKVEHLQEANAALKQVNLLKPELKYPAPISSLCSNGTISNYMLSFLDTNTGTSSYRQTGYITRLFFPDEKMCTIHVWDWHSGKQSRVVFSSSGAKILSATKSADRSLHLSESVARIVAKDSLFSILLTVHSYGLYSTITILHEGRDYRLRPTVCRLRDLFKTVELSPIQWVAGKRNLADALTKINPHTFALVNSSMHSGCVEEDIFSNEERKLTSSV